MDPTRHHQEQLKEHHRRARRSKLSKMHGKGRGEEGEVRGKRRSKKSGGLRGCHRPPGQGFSHLQHVSGCNLQQKRKVSHSVETVLEEDVTCPSAEITQETGIASREHSAGSAEHSTSETLPINKCPICLDHVPVVRLMSKCSHPAACRSCLRELYVCQAQTDMMNYPLRCFDPSCSKTIRDTQLIRHSLMNEKRERSRHHRLATLAKAQSQRRPVVSCPKCDHPCIRRAKPAPYSTTCKLCGERHLVENEHTSRLDERDRDCLRAMNVRTCRRCGSGIEHRSGCYKMKCRCGYRFCFVCGSENAQCGHTPEHHGFVDNVTGLGDFTGLNSMTSYT